MSNKIVINKNRGWRGLAEANFITEDNKQLYSMIFSFSQAMWKDLLKGYIVFQTLDDYIIIKFDNTEQLPRPDQQRSVLIKNFIGNIIETRYYHKNSWRSDARTPLDYDILYHSIVNSNNHTQSDWNYVGVRVMPKI